MTVQELLKYFGELYVISDKFIQWRMTYYSDTFTLPPMNAIIKNLKYVLTIIFDYIYIDFTFL